MIRIDPHRLPDWLLEVLHVDSRDIPADAEAWISFRRFPESGWGLLAVLAVLAGCAYVGWVYRREASLSTARKVVFAALRCAVILAIALALFAPVLEVSVERKQRATTLVFLDDSLSFGIADAYPSDPDLGREVAAAAGVSPEKLGQLSRADIAGRLLADPGARLLDRLAERNLLEVFTFSDRFRRVAAAESDGEPEGTDDSSEPDSSPGEGGHPGAAEGGPASDSPPAAGAPARISPPVIRPRGPVTDLGAAVRPAVEGQGSAPVAAVVVVTDGKVTAGEDPAGLGRFLADREVPVYSIGIGDPSPTRNIRVMALFAPERVFLDDPVVVDVRLDHRGFAGESVTVELVRAGVAGDPVEETLRTTEVTFDESAEATARFEVLMDRVGAFRLIVRVAPHEEETFENDNERSVAVEVVEQATRVLLIAGAPTNEFRILRNLLRRDRRVHLAAWNMAADPESPQEGNTILEKLPSTPAELFEYDVVLLHDPDPRGLPPGFGELLERFVGKHRGGFAFIAGEKHAGRLLGAPDMKPLRGLLAVELDLPAIRDELGRGGFHTREWPVAPTREAVSHPATRLASRPERNAERWAELPGIFWSLPVKRAKAGATVLLEHPDPRFTHGGVRRPLLAAQFYEGGRSAFLGFDETWRWRALSEEIYDQFWMQLVRSLTEGRLLGDRRRLVLTDRESYDLGDVMRISALVQDEDYSPSSAASIEVEVTTPDARVERIALDRDADRAGWFRGMFMPGAVGDYRVRAPRGAEKVVRVEVPDLEYQDPRLDRATLIELAELTGGEALPIERFAELPDLIPDRSRTVVVTDEPRPLWDSALTLAAVVLLLTVEWILRKWSRLP